MFSKKKIKKSKVLPIVFPKNNKFNETKYDFPKIVGRSNKKRNSAENMFFNEKHVFFYKKP